jgi:hypothetical protein
MSAPIAVSALAGATILLFTSINLIKKICRYNCVPGSGFVDQFPDRDRMLLVSGWSGDNLSNDEERSLLGLHIDPTKIFANYGKREQLYRCEYQHTQEHARPSGNR